MCGCTRSLTLIHTLPPLTVPQAEGPDERQSTPRTVVAEVFKITPSNANGDDAQGPSYTMFTYNISDMDGVVRRVLGACTCFAMILGSTGSYLFAMQTSLSHAAHFLVPAPRTAPHPASYPPRCSRPSPLCCTTPCAAPHPDLCAAPPALLCLLHQGDEEEEEVPFPGTSTIIPTVPVEVSVWSLGSYRLKGVAELMKVGWGRSRA